MTKRDYDDVTKLMRFYDIHRFLPISPRKGGPYVYKYHCAEGKPLLVLPRNFIWRIVQ